MFVRLRNKFKKSFVLLLIIVFAVRFVNTSVYRHIVTHPEINNELIAKNGIQNMKAEPNFRIDIPYPEYIEYWEVVNLSIEIAELKNRSWTNISIELKWSKEGQLFLLEGVNKTQFLGDIGPNETIKVNYQIKASSTKLSDPLVVGFVYLYQDDVRQDVFSYSWYEGEYRNWGVQGYGLFAIDVRYPLLEVDGPLEIGGVLPVLEIAFGENLTITFNLTNPSKTTLKNLSLHYKIDESLLEILSTSFTFLDSLPNESFILVKINIRCKADFETETILFFNVTTSVLSPVTNSVRIKIIAEHLALNYDNILVFYSWPIFIFSFSVLALIIAVFTFTKTVKTKRIERELEEKYGKSLID